MSGDTFAEDDINQESGLVYATDFADFKLNSEVYLRGSCHPAGGPATHSAVRVSVGSWSKTLQVTGPRAYKPGVLLGGKAGEPQPFAKMPLTWQNAYGGEDYPLNPVGRGHKGEELATVEYPDSPIKKVGQKNVTPASFEPISPHWPQRANKRGKNYGAKWKKTRAPFYSDDFDWSYFQSAPEDQQIDGYLRGDEEMTFENLHPEVPVWKTKLPSIRIRTFVKTTDGKIHEPTMNLDTLYADLEDGKLYLTWRGLSPIKELDMTDVGAVLIAQEKLEDEPVDPQVYIKQLEEFEHDPVGLKTAFPAGFMMFADAIESVEQAELNGTPMPDLKKVAEELPPECPFPPWFLAAAAGDEDPLGITEQFPPGMLDGDPAMGQGDKIGGLADPVKQAKMFEDIAKLKDDPGLAAEVLEGVVSLLPADKQAPFKEGLGALSQALSQSKADLGDDVFTKAAENAAGSQQAKPAAESYGDMMNTANTELSTANDMASTPDSVAKVTEAQGKLGSAPQTLDDAVAQAMEPLNDIELPEMPEIPDVEADLAAKSAKIDQDEARMRAKFGDEPILGLYDMGRNLIANAPRPEDVCPDLSAIPAGLQKAQDALSAQGISMAAMAPLVALNAKVSALVAKIPQPAPLPEGEFVGRDLRANDFSNRDLTGECFCKSDLTAAKFVNSNLTGSDFTKADLTKADLTGAILTDATFKGSTLTKANLKKVTAHRTIFADTTLDGADFTEADLDGAKLTSARGAKILFPKAKLTNIDARFADLSKADLQEADLTDANLSFATLNLVKGDKANFTNANLDIAKLTKSRLHGAIFRGSKCNMGQFTSSNLTGADLRECNYERADFMKAVLDEADFRDATLTGVTLRDTTATGTNFQHASLTGCSATGEARFLNCDFRHSTGSRSIWMDVDLTGSTFRHATFDSAFFNGAKGTDIDFIATVMKHANFRKVQFTRTSFACADLGGVIFQDASLDDADFQKANCYDAKFLGAKAVRCRFEDAFLHSVQLDDPDQQLPGSPA